MKLHGQARECGYAYFFFDFNNPQKQVSELMVRSILRQLCRQCTKIPAVVEKLYMVCDQGQRQPSLGAMLEVLQHLFGSFSQCHVVLDALDECNDQAELLSVLEQWHRWDIEGLRLLVTGRKERNIESGLEGIVDKSDMVCLQSGIVDKDIQLYVRRRLQEDKSLYRWQKDSVVREEIETALMKGAHGMCVSISGSANHATNKS
jgi:hypothetical protein